MQYKKIVLNNSQTNENSGLLEKLLSIRGIEDKEAIEKFLNPTRDDFLSPYLFSDMEKAIERIRLAIKNNEKILVWGDFDCDGVTSTSILYKALKKLNADVITFIPDRLTQGHGLNTKKLIQLYAKEKFKLIITVDCGISNVNEINLLNGFKVDTIITDHHTIDTQLPKAFAIINPQVKGAIKEDTKVEDITSMTYNCGAVVAYKVAMALLEEDDDNHLKDELLLLAACGAIGDIVPILGENRAIVSVALEFLNSKKENSKKSIYKLLSNNIKDRDFTSTDIAFVLTPRINAVGRLSNAELSFEFLTTQNENKLDIIIEKLDNFNTIRQAKCAETFEEIDEYLKSHKEEQNNPAIILINKDWHIGIIGIVASKIVEHYAKPCFLMTIDETNHARCSIRSNENINVYEVLKQNQTLFSGFGGHKLAGGCSFDLNQITFEEVKSALISTINDNFKENKTQNVLKADIEVKEDELDSDLIETLNKLEPFGERNKAPICAMFNVKLKETKTIGKDNNHLRLTFSKNDKILNAIKWQESSILVPKDSECDIAFYPRINSFNGATEIQLDIVDVYSDCINQHSISPNFKLFDHRKKTGILDSISEYLKNSSLDIKIWAKTPKTKEALSKFENLKNNFLQDTKTHNGLMFFDYPASLDEFSEIIETTKPKKIHFMYHKIDENIENCIKQLNGMIKYCSSKLQGNLELEKLAFALGTNIDFVQIAIEILENLKTIEFDENDKIKYLKPFVWEDFCSDSIYESLIEEFDKIIEFKNELLNCEMKKIEEIIENLQTIS